MNHEDNPWFPKVFDQERRADRKRLSIQDYAWVWDGDYRENSDAQILSGKVVVREFEPSANWNGPYYGIDWGFSQDPCVGVKCWVHDDRLWIEYEAGRVGLENDDIADYMIQRIPAIESHVIRSDSARPETISHVKQARNGRKSLPRLVGVEKWKGSVEDGIAHLRSYSEIVIHERCKETILEARKYSYKVDKLSGDVMTDIVDKHNHYIDATRYAVDPLIKRRTQAKSTPFTHMGR